MHLRKLAVPPYTETKKTKTLLLSEAGQIRVFILTLVLFISPFIISCAQLNTVGDQIQLFYWDIQKNMRKPGEKLITHPNQVWEKYHCGKKDLPLFLVETNEILPPKLHAGKELNHHFVYVMCPAEPSQVIRGRLTRSIYYKGHVIFKDETDNFEFKPGEWCVDAFITIPPEAEPGVYSLEVSFSGIKHPFSKNEHFVVIPSGA